MQESESARDFLQDINNLSVDNIKVEHNYYYILGSIARAYRNPAEVAPVTELTRGKGQGRMRSGEEGRGKKRNLGGGRGKREEEKAIMTMG